MNKSECIKHVVFDCALNVLSWNVAILVYITVFYTHTPILFCKYFAHTCKLCVAAAALFYIIYTVSMGIVGVKSTAGREVKFIDPSKTTKSESTWLGYPLCD